MDTLKESTHPQSLPLGGKWAGEAGSDEGAILYPTFPCRNKKKGGSQLSPQRNFYFLPPLGNPVAPSSVTFGASFPPRGSLWVVLPYTKKSVPNQGTYMGPVIAPPPEQCGTTAKTSERQRAGHGNGGPRGLRPGPLSPHFSGEMGTPAGQAGPPGRCAPRHRKSPDHPKGTQYPTAPPPGTGREPTSQGLTCAGPRPDHLPTEAPAHLGTPAVRKKDLAIGQVLFIPLLRGGLN